MTSPIGSKTKLRRHIFYVKRSVPALPTKGRLLEINSNVYSRRMIIDYKTRLIDCLILFFFFDIFLINLDIFLCFVGPKCLNFYDLQTTVVKCAGRFYHHILVSIISVLFCSRLDKKHLFDLH